MDRTALIWRSSSSSVRPPILLYDPRRRRRGGAPCPFTSTSTSRPRYDDGAAARRDQGRRDRPESGGPVRRRDPRAPGRRRGEGRAARRRRRRARLGPAVPRRPLAGVSRGQHEQALDHARPARPRGGGVAHQVRRGCRCARPEPPARCDRGARARTGDAPREEPAARLLLAVDLRHERAAPPPTRLRADGGGVCRAHDGEPRGGPAADAPGDVRPPPALRQEHKAALIPEIETIMLTRTKGEWVDLLEQAGVPCAPIHTFLEVLAHPQTAATGMIQKVPELDLELMGLPISFDGERPPLRGRAPRLGEHNQEIRGGGTP